MNVLAIDPGASGAIATFDGTTAWCCPFPDDWDETDCLIQAHGTFVDRIVIEKVHAMPGGGERRMGATSAFKLGWSDGWLARCAKATHKPREYVAPQTWQKGLGLGKCAGPERKRALKALAQQRFPGLKVTLRTADALLLAEWAWLKWNAAQREEAAS